MKPAPWIAALAALAALAGCAAFQPHYDLPGSPETSGLVIVQGECTSPLVRWGRVFAGGAHDSHLPFERGHLVADPGVDVLGRGIDGGVVVFNPPPGRYRVDNVGFVEHRSTGPYPVTFDLPPQAYEAHPELVVTVRPGQVAVVSKLILHYRDASLMEDFAFEGLEVVQDTGGEKAAIAAVLPHVEAGNPWRPVLEARLRSLGP